MIEQYIIDRFEGTIAVCETQEKTFINILKSELPSNVKEGDCIAKCEDGSFILQPDRTRERKEKARKLMESLYEQG